MKTKRETGGPAFARSGYEDRTYGSASDGDRTIAHEDGMTLRDYFAARAMQGVLAASETQYAGYLEVAEMSYRMADAMLAARLMSEEVPA